MLLTASCTISTVLLVRGKGKDSDATRTVLPYKGKGKKSFGGMD